MTRLALVPATLLLAFSPAFAQDAITIKLRKPADGDVLLVKKSDTSKTSFVVVDAAGTVLLDKKESKGRTYEFTETILKQESDLRVSKAARDYAKAQLVLDGKSKDGPLQGKSIVAEWKGDKYEFTYKSGEKVEGDAANDLTDQFKSQAEGSNKIELMMPKGPVKVGASWQPDVAAIAGDLAKALGGAIDAGKSNAKGTLVKVHEKDKRKFGEMKFHMEFIVQTLGKGDGQLTFAPGTKMVVEINLDACIDGSAQVGVMRSKMSMSGNATLATGQSAMIDISAEGTNAQDVPRK
jgi:hypothetical protein